MNRFLLLALIGASIFVSPIHGALAQDAVKTPPASAAQTQAAPQKTPEAATTGTPAPATAPSTAVEAPATGGGALLGGSADANESEITVMKDNFATSDYITPNMENLSKLYWRLSVFKLADNAAVDNYLIINECDVYRNFYKDDFEWSGVRKATRDMLQQQSASFSNKFKILVPIDLGRYEDKRGGFTLTNSTAFVNSRRVQVTGNSLYFTGCDQKGDLNGYPSRVVLILNKPFTFNFIKVDEHVAQAFLLRKKYNSVPLPRELRNKGFQRPAFARMRVTFVRYQGTMDDGGGRKLAILYGTLDGIDVFEDIREEMLLTSINYQ